MNTKECICKSENDCRNVCNCSCHTPKEIDSKECECGHTALEKQLEEVGEKVQEIQTQLHNGHLEPAYKLANQLLLDLNIKE